MPEPLLQQPDYLAPFFLTNTLKRELFMRVDASLVNTINLLAHYDDLQVCKTYGPEFPAGAPYVSACDVLAHHQDNGAWDKYTAVAQLLAQFRRGEWTDGGRHNGMIIVKLNAPEAHDDADAPLRRLR